MKTVMMWWHKTLPKAYYLCCTADGKMSDKKHRFHRWARRDAVNMAKRTNEPVYIFKAVDIVLPCQPHPHPEILIHQYDDGLEIRTEVPYTEGGVMKTALPSTIMDLPIKGLHHAHESQ